jgi:hypothetical protein
MKYLRKFNRLELLAGFREPLMSRDYRDGLIAGSALVLCSLLVVWGVICLLPNAMFATSPVYREYSRIASETQWGIASILLGLAQAAGTIKRIAWLLIIGGFFMLLLFAFGALLYLSASTTSAAGYMWLLFAAWEFLVVLTVLQSLGRS